MQTNRPWSMVILPTLDTSPNPMQAAAHHTNDHQHSFRSVGLVQNACIQSEYGHGVIPHKLLKIS